MDFLSGLLVIITSPLLFSFASGTCGPGEYALSGSCYSCMSGSYSSGFGASRCSACAVGAFSDGGGATSCVACEAGSFQYAQGSSGCLSCSEGTIQPDSGATVCMACSAGFAQPLTGATACDSCASGSFAWSTMATSCISCGVGTYQPQTMATSCIGCNTGTYQSSSVMGATACIACSPGFYQPDQEAAACVSCGAGSYQTIEAATACVACSPGMHGAGSTSCSPCQAGSFTSVHGSTVCVGCSSGTYQDTRASSSCFLCGSGSYQPQRGMSVCDLCQAGTFSTGEGMVTQQVCRSCVPGTFSTGLGSSGNATCITCSDGRFSSGTGQTSDTSCAICPLGTFTSEDGSSCLPCPSDEFCPEGSSAPVKCQHSALVCNGTHLEANEGWLPVFLFGNCTDALKCPSGTRCAQQIPGDKGVLSTAPTAQTYIMLFEHGPYSVCDGGLTYGYKRLDWPLVTESENTNTVLFYLLPRGCDQGYFLRDEVCRPCPNGTFSTTRGGLDPDTCIACKPGTFGSSPGSTTCLSCAPGSYEPSSGMSICHQCLPGTFQSSAGGLGCVECLPGTFSDSLAVSQCTLCAAGYFQSARSSTLCLACNSSTEYSSKGDSMCFTCGQPPSQPVGCEPGEYPVNSEAVWISVSGLNDDGCAAVLSDGVRVQDAYLYPGAVCKHTLHVLGRRELSPAHDWIGEPSQSLSSFAVLGYNQTFYPALCAREWFGVLFTTHAYNATFDILDPTGKHLLFQGGCEPILIPPLPIPVSRCHTMSFCPTMDVLVRVNLPSPSGMLSGSVSLKAGTSTSCPPARDWVAVLELHSPSVPFFPGDVLRVDFSVANPPADQRLLAFRFVLQVRSGFQFIAFTSDVPVKQEFTHGKLVVEGDMSSSRTTYSLGQLALQLDAHHTGTLRAVRLEQDSFQFMVAQGNNKWFAVGVRARGVSCRRDGVVEVVVDHPRVTQLIVQARRSRLVHWRGVQDHASVFSTSVDVLGVWNNFAFPTPLEHAVCRSLSPAVLQIASCSEIVPVGAGKGRILVSFENAPRQVHEIWVSQPSSVLAVLGRNNRLRVQAVLYGEVVDISPYVLGENTPVTPGISLSGMGDDMLTCGPGFVGNYTVGKPILFHGECLPVSVWDPPRLSDTLYLFAGNWTRHGDFRFHPSLLDSSMDKAGILFFRDGILQPAGHAILENTDPSRVVVTEQEVRLVRHGQTPRCVSLGQFWSVPVVPPAPDSLQVELTASILVVQQDMWRLVPTQSALAAARLFFTDGSSMDVGERLVWQTDPEYLEVSSENSVVKTRTRDGSTTVSFSLADFPCVQAVVGIQIFVSSVLTTTLVCPKCPEQLVVRTDPLSLQWPFRFPSAVFVESFMVKRLLVDGSTHEQTDPLQVAGGGVLEGDRVVAVRSGELSVSSAFAREPITIRVIERCAVDYAVLCNSRACEGQRQKLAPLRDGASLPPFRYVTRLELGLELTMFDGSVSRFSWLPQVTILANGNSTTTSLTDLSPGPLDVRVQFASDWRFDQQSLVQFSLHVDSLVSLRLQVPSVLYQLHCTRLWQRGSVSVMAVLTDGVEADVRAGLVVDGQILHLDPTRAFVEVDWPGEGHVNASFGGMYATAVVLASLENTLFTGISLDSVPEQWTASVGARIPMYATLSPVLEIADHMLVLQRVIHWSVEPAGIVDLDDEAGILTLLSDHYEPVKISAVLRGCQMSIPISFSRSIQVNVAPDREGQVDFGAENGPPLARVVFDDILVIPVYLFVSKPIQSYRAVVSLPGIKLNNCTTGELPFGKCSPSGSEVSMSFAASQRTGRLWIGTFSGRVRLNNTLSRLSVSVQSSSGDSVYSFTVRIGIGRIQPAIPLVNTFVAGWAEKNDPVMWPGVKPLSIQACCDLLVVGSGSLLTHLFPTSFRLQNLTVGLADPRIRVEYDDLVLRLDTSAGVWTVERDAQEYMESTSILVHYTHPDTLETLETSISVTFAKEQKILLYPTTSLVLSRIHCSAGTFQTKQVNASLLLRSGHVFPLSEDADLANVTVSHADVVFIMRGLAITGLSVGNASLTLHSLGIQASLLIHVQTTSVGLVSVHMPDPYVLSAPYGGKRLLYLTGVLESGEILPGLAFLNPQVTVDGPALYQAGDKGGLIAQGNTHPSERHVIRVDIPSCATSQSLQVTSRLTVHLLANLTSRSPADVLVEAGSLDFNVTLAALYGVTSYLIYLQTDPPVWALANWSCQSGPDRPSFADCAPVQDGVILVGSFRGKREAANSVLARISPTPAHVLFGYIEYYAGMSSQRLPIIAGRFGAAPVLPLSEKIMPVADPAMLAKQYELALQHPWDKQAMRDAQFTLLLLADRQRLVDARVYSNENELSVMFRVTDRFLLPDTNRTSISVLFHTRKLPPHPDAVDVPSKGMKVPVRHVVDGWYAVQWVEKIPRLSLKITYEVSTSTSLAPWEYSVPTPVITGRPMHACPRFATDQASFLVVYKLPPPAAVGRKQEDLLARRIACSVQVAPRRVTVSGLVATIGVESFIRMHQVHQALADITSMDTQTSDSRRRLLQENHGRDIQRVGLVYINDTADPAIPCPPGTYFTSNGTYQPLPLHSVVGPDCYGMSCMEGYTLLGAACVPATVSLDLVWVCVTVILGLILLCSCIICALHMGRRKASPPLEPVQMTPVDSNSFPDSTEPFTDIDDQEFKNIMLGSYIDDYSRTIIDCDDCDFDSPEYDFRSTSTASKYRVANI